MSQRLLKEGRSEGSDGRMKCGGQQEQLLLLLFYLTMSSASVTQSDHLKFYLHWLSVVQREVELRLMGKSLVLQGSDS